MTAEEMARQVEEEYTAGKISKDEALRRLHWLTGENCDNHSNLDRKRHIGLIICDIIVKIITLGIVKLIKNKR